MTAKMREDRETITTTSTPLNTMDELGYRELETENKNLKTQIEIRLEKTEHKAPWLTEQQKLQEMPL